MRPAKAKRLQTIKELIVIDLLVIFTNISSLSYADLVNLVVVGESQLFSSKQGGLETNLIWVQIYDVSQIRN